MSISAASRAKAPYIILLAETISYQAFLIYVIVASRYKRAH